MVTLEYIILKTLDFSNITKKNEANPAPKFKIKNLGAGQNRKQKYLRYIINNFQPGPG